jgi:hypothetical protein
VVKAKDKISGVELYCAPLSLGSSLQTSVSLGVKCSPVYERSSLPCRCISVAEKSFVTLVPGIGSAFALSVSSNTFSVAFLVLTGQLI